MKKMLVLLLVMFVFALSSTVSAHFNSNNASLNQDGLMFAADGPDGPPDPDQPPDPNAPPHKHHRHHEPEPPHDPPPPDDHW